MRTPALILAVMAATPLVASAGPQDKANSSPKEQIAESTRKVKELQKERIAALKAAADTSLKLAQRARLEISEATEDGMALLKAELEVAEKESDRIALYKQALDLLKGYEEIAKARQAAARGTELAVLKVKARRLEVEILLEQAKIKEAKGSK